MTDGYDLMRLVRETLTDEWREQMATGSMTLAGLCRLRGMVAGDSGLFAPGPALELFRLEVDDAVAGMLGVDPADMPGAPSFPDSPAGL